MISLKTNQILNYSVYSGQLDTISLTEKTVINTINQYSYCMAEEDYLFKKALLACDVLLPDGVGIVMAAKLVQGLTIKKIAGADLHSFLLNKLNERQGSCFYMGAAPETLKKIELRIGKEFPNVKVGSYSPPFKKVFSKEDNLDMLKAINTFNPDALFVGLTAPKQEKWSLQHKDMIAVKGPICSIGAVFDFYAGTIARPNSLWQGLGLEWLGRLLKEPKRMWKRYIYYGIIFGGYLIKAKARRNSAFIPRAVRLYRPPYGNKT